MKETYYQQSWSHIYSNKLYAGMNNLLLIKIFPIKCNQLTINPSKSDRLLPLRFKMEELILYDSGFQVIIVRNESI